MLADAQLSKLQHIPSRTIKKIQKQLIRWGRNNYNDFPWRKTTNLYHALIAEIMLQRTKAEQVLPVFEAFVNRYPNMQSAANEDPKQIHRLLKSLGLKWRVDKIIELTKTLITRKGSIPCDRKELIQLPGVGIYIANAILSFHMGFRAAITDRNAVRLWSRMFGFVASSEVHRKRWFIDLAESLTPSRNFKRFNYALLDFTKAVCKPKPLCASCLLRSICVFSGIKN